MRNIESIYIGSNFHEHDSAIFVVEPEAHKIFAVSTERLTRHKHDKLFAIPVLEKYVTASRIDPAGVKNIYFANSFLTREKETCHPVEYELQLAERKHWNARFTKDLETKKKQFYGKPLARIFDLLKTSHGRFILWHKFTSVFGKKKIRVEDIMRKHLKRLFPNANLVIEYYDHQQCHATSSYFSSPFKDALLFSYDAWGDDLFSRVISVKDGGFTEIAKSPCHYVKISSTSYPNIILGSPAGIYAYVTDLLGFKPTSEEGKVEALAAFAKPNEELYNIFMSLFSIDKKSHSLVCDVTKAEKIIPRTEMIKFVNKYKREEIAASVQKFLDDITFKYLTHIFTITDQRNLCLSGGATANVIMNLMIFEKLTDKIHITPAMADDGTSQGAVILSLMKHGYSMKDLEWLRGEKVPYYGTSYSKTEITKIANTYSNSVQAKDLGDSWPEHAAKLLSDGKIGAIFHGKMEWGPRALGNRSIIADPRRPDFREKINREIKRRPAFQPFCPSILAEEAPRLFEKYYLNRHMTCAFRMKREFWNKLPSAIHIDGTARAQFVTAEDNPNYYRLLKKVKDLTGYGVIINTSFNKHGRTIVETPRDAIVDFLDTDMDYVIIEGLLITRK